mmetsp:Transcript_39898/g.46685  ORF Transcript_39898/g.46685 Transcript_39898/m.46685 type:complete len:98 (-) Transcript_39898:92-385(-)
MVKSWEEIDMFKNPVLNRELFKSCEETNGFGCQIPPPFTTVTRLGTQMGRAASRSDSPSFPITENQTDGDTRMTVPSSSAVLIWGIPTIPPLEMVMW